EGVHEYLGPGAEVDAPIPTDACQTFGPQQPVGNDGTVSGRAVDPDRTGGYQHPVVVRNDHEVVLGSVRLSCGTIPLSSTEQVRFNSGYRPNENPIIERLELRSDGRTVELAPGADAEPAQVAPGSQVEFVLHWPA